MSYFDFMNWVASGIAVIFAVISIIINRKTVKLLKELDEREALNGNNTTSR